MINVIKIDIYHILSKYKKQIIFFLGLIIINSIILHNSTLEQLLGLDFKLKTAWYLTYYLVFNTSLIYIISYLYQKDMENNIEFILTRVTSKTWLNCKIIDTVIISLFINILVTITWFIHNLLSKNPIDISWYQYFHFLLFQIMINSLFLLNNRILPKVSIILSIIEIITFYIIGPAKRIPYTILATIIIITIIKKSKKTRKEKGI